MKNNYAEIVPYLFIRLMMLFAILIQTIWYDTTKSFDESSVKFSYLLLSSTFFITAIYTVYLEKISNHIYFVMTQLFYDVLLVTALLVNTKSAESIYSLFFFITIMVSAIWFKAKGGLFAAVISSVLYLSVMSFKGSAYGVKQPENFALFPTAMIAVALLTGQLVEELKRSKLKAQKLENISEEIVESLDSGLLITDAEGRIQKINKTTYEMLGIFRNDLITEKKVTDLGLSIQYFPGIQEIEVNGEFKKILINRINLLENQKMYILRDLTEILSMEEKLKKQEKLASIGRLTAGVAHEIRNPIASISGAAQMISSDQSHLNEDELKKMIQIIERESDRVNMLVTRMLALTKPSVKEDTKIDLKKFIQEIVESILARADVRENSIDVEVKVEDGIEIVGSKEQLKEVFNNLIVNSVQSLIDSSNQNKKIQIIANKIKKGAQIKVIDNGVGISKDAQKQIFTPFFTTKPSGTGLGLAQVHKIITEYDGTIEVKSELGKGAEFLLKIPV